MNKATPTFLLLMASPAFSQNLLFDPMIVTASRMEQREDKVPYSTAYIDSESIWQDARRTLPDALQYTPGVLVQKTANGHGSPFIRGFTGRENLLLLDGVRFNNSTLRSGPVQYWNTVDPFSLDHLELVKSQGSVLYGSDAVGGTLNAFTKSSDFRARTTGESYFSGSAAYEFRSNGQSSNIGRFEAEAGVGGEFGVWLGFTAKDYGDIEDSSVGRMTGTGYPEQDVDFRADYAVTADSTLTLAYNYVNQDNISRWHRTLENPGWEHGEHLTTPGLWNADTFDQERSMTYLRYAGENTRSDAFIRNWSATISFQTSADSEYQDRNPSKDSIRKSNIDLNTFGADLTLESDAGPGTVVYGFDYYHDDVDASGYQKKANGSNSKEDLPVADDSQYDLFGAFGQYVWKPVDPLEITAGARYTYAMASLGRFHDSAGQTQNDESQDWNSVVGSLRGLYRINSCWSLFGGISQAFRAPNLVDLTGNLSSRSGNESLGSTDVNPEKFLTSEIGARQTTETTSIT
jgi:hemoglobin/transferrin/lactoferrin receptor protein